MIVGLALQAVGLGSDRSDCSAGHELHATCRCARVAGAGFRFVFPTVANAVVGSVPAEDIRYPSGTIVRSVKLVASSASPSWLRSSLTRTSTRRRPALSNTSGTRVGGRDSRQSGSLRPLRSRARRDPDGRRVLPTQVVRRGPSQSREGLRTPVGDEVHPAQHPSRTNSKELHMTTTALGIHPGWQYRSRSTALLVQGGLRP